MHGRVIVQACLERGLWATDALDPNIAGTTTLYSEIRRASRQTGVYDARQGPVWPQRMG